VRSFRCEGASSEIPDFPETPEKSPEYPGFTDKFVLSSDFQDSPIHPPSRRHQDPFTGEVDRARALQDEEEVVEVQLHQIQGFIGVFFFFGTFRMLL
jgi:hypothetical protein